MRRLNRFSLVGTLLRNNLHTNKDTFRGIDQCQMNFEATTSKTEISLVRIPYAPLTYYIPSGLGDHIQQTYAPTCKDTSRRMILHLVNKSSSHALRLLLHRQPSQSPHPKLAIYVTFTPLSSVNSKSRQNLTQKGTSPIHLSVLNKVSSPSPIVRHKFSSNHPSPNNPTPYLIQTKFFHQTNPCAT